METINSYTVEVKESQNGNFRFVHNITSYRNGTKNLSSQIFRGDTQVGHVGDDNNSFAITLYKRKDEVTVAERPDVLNLLLSDYNTLTASQSPSTD